MMTYMNPADKSTNHVLYSQYTAMLRNYAEAVLVCTKTEKFRGFADNQNLGNDARSRFTMAKIKNRNNRAQK